MDPMKILCLGTTPAVQRVMVFRKLALDAVNRAATTLDGAAGKSINVAKVLKTLGEQPVATGFLGGDRGEFLRVALMDKGIESDFVTVSTGTRQCLTMIDESAGTHTELVEESHPVKPADFDKLMAVVRRRASECRALVMSGTTVTGGPANLYFDCAKLAENAGAMASRKGRPRATPMPFRRVRRLRAFRVTIIFSRSPWSEWNWVQPVRRGAAGRVRCARWPAPDFAICSRAGRFRAPGSVR